MPQPKCQSASGKWVQKNTFQRCAARILRMDRKDAAQTPKNTDEMFCRHIRQKCREGAPKRLSDLRFTRTVFHKRLLWKTFFVLFSVRRRVLPSLPKVQNHAFLWRSGLWEQLKACFGGMTSGRFPAAFLTALHRQKNHLRGTLRLSQNAPAGLILPDFFRILGMRFSTGVWKTGMFGILNCFSVWKSLRRNRRKREIRRKTGYSVRFRPQKSVPAGSRTVTVL